MSHSHKKPEILTGGNMNAPVLIGNTVHRKTTKATETIHKFLNHLLDNGIDFVPRPLGYDKSGKEVLSYISGQVPHDMPDWIWEEKLLIQMARAMRRFHDASSTFPYKQGIWGLPANQPIEVICHNDFAPYNCVFESGNFKGVFDFDLCSPGPRIWDLAYTAYRFVPIMPTTGIESQFDISPFPFEVVKERALLFLKTYSGDSEHFHYSLSRLLETVSTRLDVLSKWTLDFGTANNNPDLLSNAKTYMEHKGWIEDICKNGALT